MEPILRAEDLRFAYEDSPAPVLRGITLDFYPGTFTAVLGANGSGKSTFARHMNAILRPTGGRMLVAGMDTADEENIIPIRRMVGMVFQNPDNQIVANVVEDDVAFAPENLGIPSEEIRDRVDGALKLVGMYDFRMHAPHLLSGGQKQRVAIAGVLAMKPEVLVLDEPTAMLDPAGRREVIDTVYRLCRECGITVILITHHMEEAARADRVVVLDSGSVVMDGTPREIFPRTEELRRCKMTVPDATALADMLISDGLPLRPDILTAEECADAIKEALCR